MTSVRTIADRLGISVATVSRALNNHAGVSETTRKRVLAAANQSGYRPSVGLRPTNIIGLAYPDEPVRADFGAFEAALLAGVLEGASENKFDLSFVSVTRDKHPEESYDQFFHRKGVRGVLVRALNDSTMAERIAEEGFPMVLVADRCENPVVSYIDSDSRGTSELAVAHLIGLGHRRIGLAVHDLADSDHRDREAGYRDAHARGGLRVDESLVVRMPASPDGGAAMIETLLDRDDPPTAVFFTDPLSTVGALHRCLQLQVRVPSELSVIGFDDSDIRTRTFPRFTAVCQDACTLGLEAAKWLTGRLAAETVSGAGPMRATRPTTLAHHESTAGPPVARVRLKNGQKSLVI